MLVLALLKRAGALRAVVCQSSADAEPQVARYWSEQPGGDAVLAPGDVHGSLLGVTATGRFAAILEGEACDGGGGGGSPSRLSRMFVAQFLATKLSGRQFEQHVRRFAPQCRRAFTLLACCGCANAWWLHWDGVALQCRALSEGIYCFDRGSMSLGASAANRARDAYARRVWQPIVSRLFSRESATPLMAQLALIAGVLHGPSPNYCGGDEPKAAAAAPKKTTASRVLIMDGGSGLLLEHTIADRRRTEWKVRLHKLHFDSRPNLQSAANFLAKLVKASGWNRADDDQRAPAATATATATTRKPSTGGAQRGGSKKKGATGSRKRKRRDPNKPSGYISAFNFFTRAERASLRAANGALGNREFNEYLSKVWREQPPEQRYKYDLLAEQDKRRYIEAMATYTPTEGFERAQTRIRTVTDAKSMLAKRRKKNRKGPKRPRSAYLFFAQDHRVLIRTQHPEAKFDVIGRMLGLAWKGLNDEQRAVYTAKSNLEKAQYAELVGKTRRPPAGRATVAASARGRASEAASIAVW